MSTNHTNHIPPLATVYAQAMLSLANEQNRAEEIGQQLRDLQALVCNDPTLRAFFSDPSISQSERAGVLDRSFCGRVCPLVMNLLCVLNAKGRLKLLSSLGDAYSALLEAQQNKVQVDVIVAQKLCDEELEKVRQKVSHALNKDAVVHQKVDESIIGGLVIRVQDRLIDASTRYQLEAMRQQLLEVKPR